MKGPAESLPHRQRLAKGAEEVSGLMKLHSPPRKDALKCIKQDTQDYRGNLLY